MQSILFWLLVPFTLPQALRLKKSAIRLPEAEGAKTGNCESIELSDTVELSLVGIGDSVIVGVGVQTLEESLVVQTAKSLTEASSKTINWQVLGKNGANSEYVIRGLVPRLPKTQVDIFLLSVGVNDVTSLSSLSEWQTNLRNIITALGKHSPNAIIVMAGVPPMGSFPLLPQPLRKALGMRSSMLDRTAKEVLSEFKSTFYVPLDSKLNPDHIAVDGYHPSAQGCSLFGNMIAKSLIDFDGS